MTITIYGYSDDLIAVEGDISEEFEASGRLPDTITCSNGATMEIFHDYAGVWRISLLSGADLVTIDRAPDQDDDNYSDRATVAGDIKWIRVGKVEARR